MDLPISLIEKSIGRGDILLSEFDGIDHRKFFVVMGVNEENVCGFFFINSNIHPAILSEISEGIKNGTTMMIGKMKDEHVADVVEMVRASNVISERHKKMFFY